MSLQPPPSREKLPVINGWAEMPRAWIKYFTELANQAGATAATAWSSISKSGSSLADLETRNHSALQNLNTADYSHLYLADRDNLVGGDDTVLHYHDSDRARANHTGTQLAATISDFDSAVTGSTHSGLTDNPHAVTAAQAGAKVSGAVEGIATGGTGQTTAQAAIDALTAVSAATNEHVLTKDTATGNAIWKASGSGVSLSTVRSVATLRI